MYEHSNKNNCIVIHEVHEAPEDKCLNVTNLPANNTITVGGEFVLENLSY